MRMQGQANCPLDEPPDPGEQHAEAIETGRLPPEPSSVAFAAGRKQNAARKYDRQTFTRWNCRRRSRFHIG